MFFDAYFHAEYWQVGYWARSTGDPVVVVPPVPSGSGGYDITDDDHEREEHYRKRAEYIARQVATPVSPKPAPLEVAAKAPADPTLSILSTLPSLGLSDAETVAEVAVARPAKPRKAKPVAVADDPVTAEIAAIESEILAQEAADLAAHNQRIEALLLIMAVAA